MLADTLVWWHLLSRCVSVCIKVELKAYLHMQTARDIYLGCLFTDVQYTLQVQ